MILLHFPEKIQAIKTEHSHSNSINSPVYESRTNRFTFLLLELKSKLSFLLPKINPAISYKLQPLSLFKD
jgi:hypothetical protein